MKKKLIAGVLALGVFTTGGIVGATASSIDDAKLYLQSLYDHQVEEDKEEVNRKVEEEIASNLRSEIDRMNEETYEYYQVALDEYYEEVLKSKKQEQKQKADKHIEDVKKHIDKLLKENAK